MSGSLLRRPLPSNKKKKVQLNGHEHVSKSYKRPLLPAIKDYRQRYVFDIYEDGDQNLMKPLGPEPFFPKYSFNTQWNTKYQNAAKSRSIVGLIPDLSYPFDGCYEEYDGDDDRISEENDSNYINSVRSKRTSQKFEECQKQEVVHVVDIEDKDIPVLNERKPWRLALLEKEASSNGDIFDQLTKANQLDVGTSSYDPLVSSDQNHQISLVSTEGAQTNAGRYPSTQTKSVSRWLENSSTRVTTTQKQTSSLVDDIVLENYEGEENEQWSQLYEQMREELQKSIMECHQSTDENNDTCDSIIWKEEYERGIQYDQTKLNLKAQFLDVMPDLPSQVMNVLTWVNLSFNDFMEIPEPLLEARNVIYLNMRNNPLLSIPDRISSLTKIKYLNFSFCYLQDINPRLFDLQELEVLDLSYNDIRSLDNKCKNFRCLRELILDGNRVRSLPKGFLQLNLSYLQLSSNFLAKPFWRESCPVAIQSLTELCINALLVNEILDKETIEGLVPIEINTARCDYCSGHMSLGGVDVIKPVSEIFGAKNLPILFSVCSPYCRKQLLSASHVPRSDEPKEEAIDND